MNKILLKKSKAKKLLEKRLRELCAEGVFDGDYLSLVKDDLLFVNVNGLPDDYSEIECAISFIVCENEKPFCEMLDAYAEEHADKLSVDGLFKMAVLHRELMTEIYFLLHSAYPDCVFIEAGGMCVLDRVA